MAFVTRIGLTDWPQAGDTLEIYSAGAGRIAGNLVANLTDIEGGSAISNPFTIPSASFIHITTPDFERVDIWWPEADGNAGRYIAENVVIRGDDLQLLSSDPPTPYTGQKWINTTDSQFKIKTATGTIVIEAYQFIAD